MKFNDIFSHLTLKNSHKKPTTPSNESTDFSEVLDAEMIASEIIDEELGSNILGLNNHEIENLTPFIHTKDTDT